MSDNIISTSYSQIFEDIRREGNSSDSYGKKVNVSPFVSFYLLYNIDKKRKEVCISTPAMADVSRYPSWNGLKFDTATTISINNIQNISGNFLILIQENNIDPKGCIFELIVNDLFLSLKKASESNTLHIINVRLNFWAKWFRKEGETVLSEEAQQGLYGELLFLKQLIETYGVEAIDWWVGPDKTDHDFCLQVDEQRVLAEVKTNRQKGYDISVSNEFQLECKIDCVAPLYLIFYHLEENTMEGKRVPDIVNDIVQYLSKDEYYFNLFEDKLFSEKYIISSPQLYKYGFSLREDPYYYLIEGEFPRITHSNIKLPAAVSSISYTLNLAGCSSYQRTWDAFKKAVKGE